MTSRRARITPEEAARQVRVRAAEGAIRSELQTRFGSYSIDGEDGVICSSTVACINYRYLAQVVVATIDAAEAQPPRGPSAK